MTYVSAFLFVPRRLAVVIGVAALAWLPVVRGQTSPPGFDAAAQAAERQQREEQDRQREQLRRDRQTLREPLQTTSEAPVVAAPKVSLPLAGRREIRTLRIVGADHASPAFLAELHQRIEGHRIGVDDLETLLTDLTRHYLARGYVTTRAYVPDQDLSKGELLVLVVEGKIERIDEPKTLTRVFPAGAGDILNLRDLEQGIDNLNRLPSHQATLDLLPGSEPGTTIVKVRDTRSRPWRVSYSGDNTGSEGTGREQGSVTFGLDDLLGFGEAVTVNHRRAIPYRAGRQASESTMASVSVPWGYQTVTLGGSLSSYAMEFAAPSGLNLPFTGDSRSLFLRVDRVLYRGQTTRLDGYANLTWKAARNYLMGSLIDVSSRDTTIVDVGVNVSRPLAGGFGSVDASLSHGFPLFGANADPSGLPGFAPRGEFTALKLNASWSRALRVRDLAFNYATSFTAQYTPDVLYGSEQLTIGGLYAVRGFDRTNLAGDVGYVWRNDISTTLALVREKDGRTRIAARPYLAVDQGCAWSNISGLPSFSPPEGALVGGAAGVSFTLGGYTAEVFYAQSLHHTPAMSREDGRTYFRFNGSF